jgi:hypothetical protein
MLTPVVKLYSGAQASQHAQKPGVTVERGPEGARAALAGQPDSLRRRHGHLDPSAQMPLTTETYRATRGRPAAAPARRLDDHRVGALLDALAGVDTEAVGRADAIFVVAASGENAASVRLDDAPLRPLPMTDRQDDLLTAMARMLAAPSLDPPFAVLFGVAAEEAKLDLGRDADAVVRVSERAAREAADVAVDRPNTEMAVVSCEGGARILVIGAPGAACTFVFADGARLELMFMDPSALPDAQGVDLRL